MNQISSITDPTSRIRAYSQLADEFPGSSLAAFNLAIDLWRTGQHGEAGDAARRALAIAPELVDQLPPGLAASLRAAGPGDASTDRLGEVVAGYRITHRIAEDPRAQFYRVERGAERGYLRVLRRSLSQDPPVATRFVESARLLQRIRHPGLATILETGQLADGCAYVLLQPAPGELLSERIWREEPLAPLAPALGSLAEALAMLHAHGLCYLGIQPERIQVGAGAGPALQLLDSEHVRSAAMQLPTPTIASGDVREDVDPILFMAPESFSGRAELGPAADVYALGVLAYLLLCGRPPLRAAHIGELIAAHLNLVPVPVHSAAPAAPEELARLIDAMLDKDPDRRPAMTDVAEAWARIYAAPAAPKPRAPDAPDAPDAPAELAVGSMLGDYRLVRKLGGGRTGEVFEAYHERLRRRDAIKVIRPELCKSPEQAERFLREAQAANQVAHPGIVSILQQARAPGGQIYTVMELLDGDSLRDRVTRGAMPAAQVRRLCRHVAQAMAAAHERGILHRDLKPENVIVVRDPDVAGGERTKIVDFGTANLTESAAPGGPYVEGTPAYMSPEQLRDTRTAGTKADVFSLGVMMQELLAGGLRAGRHDLPARGPRWLAALIRRMQDPDPSRRPDMPQVADQLSRPPRSPWSWIGLAAAIAGLAGGGYLWHRHSAMPIAAFDFEVASTTTSSVTAQFENHSTGSRDGIAWRWTFGDGTTSTDEAPVHAFTCTPEHRAFTVSLRASNPYDPEGDTLTRTDLIRITPPPMPPARVKATVIQGCLASDRCEAALAAKPSPALGCEAPCKLTLDDTSGGNPKQLCWRTATSEPERCGRLTRVAHEYHAPGTYTITRRALYDCGDTTTVALTLTVRPRSTGPVSVNCPAGMVPVPAGSFRIGSPEGVGHANEHPQHAVTLSPYCIDKTEVTVKDYATCVTARGCSPAPLTVLRGQYTPPEARRYSALCNGPDRAGHPINCIDWNQATAYCTWAGKRLPTEAEWEYAARGDDGRQYAWGNQTPSATRLNACGPECVAMLRRVLRLDFRTAHDAPDAWETTAPVGSFREGASPFGALDMTGNVWEWTQDWLGPYAAEAVTNPNGPATGTYRVTRGASWVNTVDEGGVRAARREGNGPEVRDNELGFRCARAME